MYSERERNLKKKAGYSEFQMLTAQQVNMSSKTSSEDYRSKNKYHVKSIQRYHLYKPNIYIKMSITFYFSSSRKMEMKIVYADRSDSESDGEDDSGFELVNDPKEKQSASTKVKSLFKKSKK